MPTYPQYVGVRASLPFIEIPFCPRRNETIGLRTESGSRLVNRHCCNLRHRPTVANNNFISNAKVLSIQHEDVWMKSDCLHLSLVSCWISDSIFPNKVKYPQTLLTKSATKPKRKLSRSSTMAQYRGVPSRARTSKQWRVQVLSYTCYWRLAYTLYAYAT